MTEKELRKLRRNELLEIMLAQGREIDTLRERVADLEEKLNNREIRIAEAGSIAEATVGLTAIFEEAQKTADLFVANVKRQMQEAADAEEETRRAAIQKACDEAVEQLRRSAEAEAEAAAESGGAQETEDREDGNAEE